MTSGGTRREGWSNRCLSVTLLVVKTTVNTDSHLML